MARILIVDDDPHFNQMLRQMLEVSSHEVLEASNGDAAIETYRKQPADIDLVIIDLMMPQKDGVMTIQELISEYPHLRVIAMSGGPKGRPAWLPIAKQVGAMRVLKKPFSKDKLMEAVQEVLDDPWR